MNREPTKGPQTSPTDAVDQLVADHNKVKGLFSQFESMKDGTSNEEKGALVEKICDELTVHEAVENDVFFPAVRAVLSKKHVLEEATEDQKDAGDAIQALSSLVPGHPGYEEQVSDLGSRIAAHAAEEERDVFPQVQRSEIDTNKLGAQMSAHKAELKQN
jgi:hemerythrin superfamily protein